MSRSPNGLLSSIWLHTLRSTSKHDFFLEFLGVE